MSRIAALVVVSMLFLFEPMTYSQESQARYENLTYEGFMKGYNWRERKRVFNEITAQQRFTLMKTHLQRCLDAYRPRLSQKQVALIEESLSALSPDDYRLPRQQKNMDEVIRMGEKARAIFPKAEARQIFTLNGDYVPEN